MNRVSTSLESSVATSSTFGFSLHVSPQDHGLCLTGRYARLLSFCRRDIGQLFPQCLLLLDNPFHVIDQGDLPL